MLVPAAAVLLTLLQSGSLVASAPSTPGRDQDQTPAESVEVYDAAITGLLKQNKIVLRDRERQQAELDKQWADNRKVPKMEDALALVKAAAAREQQILRDRRPDMESTLQGQKSREGLWYDAMSAVPRFEEGHPAKGLADDLREQVRARWLTEISKHKTMTWAKELEAAARTAQAALPSDADAGQAAQAAKPWSRLAGVVPVVGASAGARRIGKKVRLQRWGVTASRTPGGATSHGTMESSLRGGGPEAARLERAREALGVGSDVSDLALFNALHRNRGQLTVVLDDIDTVLGVLDGPDRIRRLTPRAWRILKPTGIGGRGWSIDAQYTKKDIGKFIVENQAPVKIAELKTIRTAVEQALSLRAEWEVEARAQEQPQDLSPGPKAQVDDGEVARLTDQLRGAAHDTIAGLEEH